MSHAAQPRRAAPQPPALRLFCGYCAFAVQDTGARSSRVCPRCSMGLLLAAAADVAPRPGDAFLAVDELLRIRAVSRSAERLLSSRERALVGRQVGEILTSAATEPAGGITLAAVIVGAMRDESVRASAAVRPRDAYGIRFCASIAACRPGPAALLVLDPSL